MPIFWDDSGIVRHNGTAFVVNTGIKTFGVTAAHVYEAYLSDFNSGLVRTCRMSGLNIPLQERLISIGSTDGIDVATFELSAAEIENLRSRILFGEQREWPPSPPQIGWSAVVAGYPGVERIQVAEFDCSFGAICFNIPVSSVSENQFGCVFERERWFDEFGKGFPKLKFNLGGISGAPVLTLLQSDFGIVSWRLAGVAYQSVASDILGEIPFVNHARLIGPTGMIHAST